MEIDYGPLACYGERSREILRGWKPEYHQRVADADPLHATAALRRLPELNRTQDVAGIVQLVREIAPTMAAVESWDFFSSAAAIRDLCICLGSIKRHGVQPMELLGELTPTLLRCGAMAHLQPRDTLLHYTVWNPSGDALRTYTSHEEERCLIQSVKMAVPAVEQAVPLLVRLCGLSVASEEFGELMGQCRDLIGRLVDVVIYTRTHVPPRVFIDLIRPYFESFVIDGVDYRGPGAVEMPLFVCDHVLWSSRVTDPTYVGFKERYVPHLLLHLREHYRSCDGQDSVLDRVEEELASGRADRSAATVAANLELMNDIFKAIGRFRAPHLGMAYQAYAKREGSPYSHGSGGYDPPALAMILDHTRQAHGRLMRLIDPDAVVPSSPSSRQVFERAVVGQPAVEAGASVAPPSGARREAMV